MSSANSLLVKLMERTKEYNQTKEVAGTTSLQMDETKVSVSQDNEVDEPLFVSAQKIQETDSSFAWGWIVLLLVVGVGVGLTVYFYVSKEINPIEPEPEAEPKPEPSVQPQTEPPLFESPPPSNATTSSSASFRVQPKETTTMIQSIEPIWTSSSGLPFPSNVQRSKTVVRLSPEKREPFSFVTRYQTNGPPSSPVPSEQTQDNVHISMDQIKLHHTGTLPHPPKRMPNIPRS